MGAACGNGRPGGSRPDLETRRDGSGAVRRIAYTALILIFFAVIAGVAYMRSPFSEIQSVRVAGAADLSAGQILQDSGVRAGENILKVSAAAVANRLLADFPLLSAVTVRRDFFRRAVVISVRERRLAGILAADGALYEVLANGVVVGRDPSGAGVNRPIITIAAPLSISLGARVTQPDLLSVCRQLPAVAPADQASLSSLDVDGAGPGTLLAFTRDGFEIRMPVANLARSLRLFYAVHQRLVAARVAPGLVDIMANGQALYKPYPVRSGRSGGGG